MSSDWKQQQIEAYESEAKLVAAQTEKAAKDHETVIETMKMDAAGNKPQWTAATYLTGKALLIHITWAIALVKIVYIIVVQGYRG